RHLPKDGVRTSDWEQCPLTDKQVRYAGLDAYAAVLLVRHVMERRNPVFRLEPPDYGSTVRLYTGTNTRCIGE
ncbi:unnamed protein product, partial [Ectocarpus sp. 4 AP-2014]